MSYQPFRGGTVDLSRGATAGLMTYLLGVVLTAAVWVAGFHPNSGAWTREPERLADVFALHLWIQLPGLGGRLHYEFLVYTVVLIYRDSRQSASGLDPEGECRTLQ